MRKNILLITIMIILTSSISACTNGEETTSSEGTISIISLKENLPTLEQRAKSWRSDSYLAWADISVWLEQPENVVLITAAFNSPSTEFESLLVDLKTDGSISSSTVKHEIPVVHQEPINLDDWSIDSQEALDIALDKEGLEFLVNSGEKNCSFLRLERVLSQEAQPVVWRLTLSECLGDFGGSTQIDPITGEILERR